MSLQLRIFYMLNILKYERYRVSVNLSVKYFCAQDIDQIIIRLLNPKLIETLCVKHWDDVIATVHQRLQSA